MLRYYIRLDDVHAKMDLKKWNRVIEMLDKFDIKAIIGVIPENKDVEINVANSSVDFWKIVKSWQKKGHIIALHGFNHLKITNMQGLIPKNRRSEFAGVKIEEQRKKLDEGIKYFKQNNLNVEVFIPPFHSFDKNTLKILIEKNINIVYDGISIYPYKQYGIIFFPQQYNGFKEKNKGIWSICLHPSSMSEIEFVDMKKFITKNREYFVNDFFHIKEKYKNNKQIFTDILFFNIYFIRRKIFLLKKRIFSD